MPEILAPAKINLCLCVGPRREDGYHPVCSLMERVTLFDSIAVQATGGETEVRGMDIPAGENIVTRAVAALEKEVGKPLPVDIGLRKEIPVAAGLAGGSSDAAAVMKATVDIYGLELSRGRLAALALELGADVPFFLTQGLQLAEGIGEALEPAGEFPAYHIVLVAPDIELPTAEIYRLYDATGGSIQAGFSERARGVRAALDRERSLESLSSLLVNDLENPAATIAPAILSVKEDLLSLGAFGSLMSGSGPSVFGLFKGREDAEKAAATLGKTYARVWVVEPYRG